MIPSFFAASALKAQTMTASDQSSLPPVGELVQITTVDGWTAVGSRTTEAMPYVHAVGRPPVKCEDIASWSRVLVVPDTDETREAMVEAAAAALAMSAHLVQGYHRSTAAKAIEAALFAVRPPRRGPESAANKGQ